MKTVTAKESIQSRLPWGRCATYRVRFGVNELFRAFPSGLETVFL